MKLSIYKELQNIYALIGKRADVKYIIDDLAAMVDRFISKRWMEGSGANNPNLFIVPRSAAKKWKPLAISTVKQYRRKGWELFPTLDRRQGGLRSALEVFATSPSKINISVKKPYAAIHQLGGRINHPGGTPYVTVKKGGKTYSVFISKKKAEKLSKGKKPRTIKVTGPHAIDIPPRPYITIYDDEIKEMIDYMLHRLFA